MPALLSRFFLIPIWYPGKGGEIFDHGWHEMMRMIRLRLGYGAAGANARKNPIKRKSFASMW